MSPEGRVRLGTASSAAHRRRIYRIADALEMDEIGGFEVTRKRAFFAEIVWVTLHRARPRAAVWGLLALAGLALLAGLAVGEIGWPAYLLFGVAAATGLGAAYAAAPVWVVTAYGRRTRVELRFRLREIRARTVYGEICRLTGAAQQALAAREERGPDPFADIPSPPALEPT